MTPSTLHVLLAAALSFPTSPEPVVIRHDRTNEQSIELAKRFDATVRFSPDGCGTLIRGRWILTAAHVARGLSPFTPRVEVKGEAYRVRQVLLHPDSKSDGRRPPRVDLALVELEEEVPDVKPVPLYARKDEVGKDVFVVGYGDFGPGNGDLTHMNGIRRAATNTVDEAARGRLHLDFDAPPDGTSLEGVGGPGDSGGPLYLETDDGLFLAGVSSASMGGRPGTYGVIDVYARVSDFLEWVEATMKAADGEPPNGPEIIDLKENFPDDERGRLVEDFFVAFSVGDADAMGNFAETRRSAGARRRSHPAAFTHRMLRLRGELGALMPDRVAIVGPELWIVLVESEEDGWRAVHFRLATEGGDVRLDDLGMRPEPPPVDETDGDDD